jgi:hypothetical protein
MRMMSEHFSKCPKDLSQNLTIGLNLKFPAKTLTYVCVSVREFLCVVCVYCLMYHYFFCKVPQAIVLECGAI